LIALLVAGGYVVLHLWAPKRAWIRRGLVAVVCFLLSAGVVLRNREYADPLTLATVTVARWPTGKAHVTLATALAAAGRSDEAVTHLEQGVPGYPPGHYPLGAELVGRGRVDEGVAHLREFIRLYPKNPAALFARRLIAAAYYDRGQLESASRECEQVLAIYPADPNTLALLGDIRLNQRRFAEAVNAYDAARRADAAVGSDALLLTRMASALAYSNRMSDAVAIARQATTVAPNDPRVQKFAGNLLAAGGDLAAAVDAFRRAVDLDPRDQEAQALLARAQAEVAR